MEKAKYCKCLNTYCITCCDEYSSRNQLKCKEDSQELWAQGIGKIRKDD